MATDRGSERLGDDLIWTGDLNDNGRIGGRVGLYDTTLRDGEQTVGTVFSPEDKLEIAKALDGLGIDRIEAGFPRVSAEDWRAVEMIHAANLSAEVWGFSRAVRADVEALVEIGVSRSVIESPISDRKLDALGVSRQTMLDRISDAVGYATENGIFVAYFGVDGSRADLEFFEQAYKTAVNAGAREVVVVDTLGVSTPEAVETLVRKTIEWVGDSIPVHFHGHNDFGLATASAVAAVRAGATWIHGTINGMGERAGNANLLEVALTLDALYDVETNLRLEQAGEISRLVRGIAGYELEPWKPVVGENTFRRETGAVASQFHDPPAVEPYSSTLVGARRAILLGKKSGIDSIRIKSAELGIELSDDDARAVLERVKERGVAKRGLVSDDEFRELVGARDS
jgi:isopropylmalate/homocitrate/citramalate synthase